MHGATVRVDSAPDGEYDSQRALRQGYIDPRRLPADHHLTVDSRTHELKYTKYRFRWGRLWLAGFRPNIGMKNVNEFLLLETYLETALMMVSTI
uniref:Uncharacterized protein n=1 Tax=Tetranychus urticae TaxID=32264 RepID=T1K0B7_TETUR